ncbi:uncharacterized protein SCHCODRAFT_02497676, partial [Schizophyllum commune H4-8]|uniref:uncharacterized protein n=1 Tax=Schizophyllum commune (strain H4-8 / FGSC 9210) TaxID=578458 RepID=UPI002160F578
QCWKCQGYGHISAKCKHEGDVCGRCAGPHRTKACDQHGLYTCANCQGAHFSSDRRCPTRRTANAEARTAFYAQHGLYHESEATAMAAA